MIASTSTRILCAIVYRTRQLEIAIAIVADNFWIIKSATVSVNVYWAFRYLFKYSNSSKVKVMCSSCHVEWILDWKQYHTNGFFNERGLWIMDNAYLPILWLTFCTFYRYFSKYRNDTEVGGWNCCNAKTGLSKFRLVCNLVTWARGFDRWR